MQSTIDTPAKKTWVGNCKKSNKVVGLTLSRAFVVVNTLFDLSIKCECYYIAVEQVLKFCPGTRISKYV